MQSTSAVEGATRAPGNIKNVVLTTEEAAGLLRVSKRHLERLRAEGTGPPWVRLGPRRVGYPTRQLDAWIESRVSTAMRAA